MMLARATGLVAIPDALRAEEAAPILCAGIATFNALKKSGAQAGDTVAVFGIGGLGHMAVQYARRMGVKVVAVGRGQDIKQDALSLGAHHYIDTDQVDAAAWLKADGGAQAIVTTLGDAKAVSALMQGLTPQGRWWCLVQVGTPLPSRRGAGHLRRGLVVFLLFYRVLWSFRCHKILPGMRCARSGS